MRFEHSENLWFLIILLPMVLSLAGYWLWKQKVNREVLEPRLVSLLTSSQSSRLQIARQILVILSVFFMIFASAQPQWGETNRPVKRTGIDLVFAIDLSLSMLATDAAPDRLRAAKNEIETTLKALKGDRIGLVVFTSVSFQQSPLTADYGAIRFYLSKLKPHLMPRGGTSVGRAIIDSVELLERNRKGASDHSSKKNAQNQVIVLITDGEDHESDPKAAAELAASKGIEIMTVGIGSQEGEKIPVVRPNGRISGYKKDSTGSLILTKLDEASLKSIAETTKGNYIHYEGPHSVSNAILSYVSTLEKNEIESLLKARYKERFYFFLIPGFLCLLISLLLGDRKKLKAISTFTILLSLFTLSCERPLESKLSSVEKGNEKIAGEKYTSALKHYKQAEKEIPSRPDLHFNLGRAQLGLKSYDEARREYARALETKDVSLEFDALNNLGLILAAQEDWKNAHETFSQAMDLSAKHPLLIKPKLREETRWNLELAFQKLFPPCASLDLTHEEDDSSVEATPIEKQEAPQPNDNPNQSEKKEKTKYELCGGDEDWFSIPALPGTTISVKATFKDLRENPDPERAFLVKNEDLSIALLDTTGKEIGIIAEGKAQNLDQATSSRTVVREISRFVVTKEMIHSREGEVPIAKLRVRAEAGLEFSYTLEIVSIPPCYALQEESEDNSSILKATPIKKGENPLHFCPQDEDWFWIDVQEGDSFFVDIRAQKDQEREEIPQLLVDIFDYNNEKIIANNIPEGGISTTGIRNVEFSGRVAIRVSGIDRNQQGPYALDLYQFSPCSDPNGIPLYTGDDRYEENDDASASSVLDMKLPIHRYLRNCPGDPDFYKLKFEKDAKDKSVKMGVALTSFPRSDGELTNFSFDLMSPSGDSILVEGVSLENPQENEAAKKSPMPLHRGLFSKPEEGKESILRVHNGNDFYHLIQLNPQNPPQKKDEKQDESEPENEDEKSDNEKKKDDKEKGDKKNEDDEKDEKEDKSEPKEDEQPQPQSAKEEKEDPKMQRIKDLLEALEQNDDNFQLRKALEKLPKRYIEKDW